ncbi:MAG: hypothetical protein EX267_02220 [Acidimicrobiia bacterium]|nr:MAG: hypothetical protein EX267_02220 [Acidimicrobiia bacterium]
MDWCRSDSPTRFDQPAQSGVNGMVVRYDRGIALKPLSLVRRIVVTVLGVVIVLVGVVLLFIPGPGTVVIIAGLAVLGSEFERPRAWVESMRARVQSAMNR